MSALLSSVWADSVYQPELHRFPHKPRHCIIFLDPSEKEFWGSGQGNMTQHIASHLKNTVFPYFSSSESLISRMEEGRELVFFSSFLAAFIFLSLSSFISPHYTCSNSSPLHSTHSKQFTPGPGSCLQTWLLQILGKENALRLLLMKEQSSALTRMCVGLYLLCLGCPTHVFFFPVYFTGMLSRVTWWWRRGTTHFKLPQKTHRQEFCMLSKRR